MSSATKDATHSHLQHLSWQSAFLGICGLALNTMFQDAGSFEEDVYELNRYVLRSSPIACLAELLFTAIKMSALLRNESLKDAVHILAKLRYPERGSDDHKPATAKQVRSIILFVVAVLQTIKLMACSGVPWTRAAAIIYMLLYLIDGSLRRIGPNAPTGDLTHVRPSYLGGIRWQVLLTTLITVATLFQISIWVSIIFRMLPETTGLATGDVTVYEEVGIVYIFVLECCYYGALGGGGAELFEPVEDWLERHGLHSYLAILRIIFWATAILFGACIFVIVLLFPSMMRLSIAAAALTATSFIAFKVWGWAAETRFAELLGFDSSLQPTWDTCVYLTVLVIQTTVTLLYYAYVYDPQTTHKLWWARYLG
jgi:hypothetical protein